MSNIKNWNTTPLDNSDDPPHGAPEGWSPGDVNLVVRQQMADHRTQWQDAQWFNWGHTPVRQSNASFIVSGTATEVYQSGVRLRLYDTTTIMGEVLASSMSGANTLVSISSSSISSSLSAVDISIFKAEAINLASKSDVLKSSIGATFSSVLPVPAEVYKHHPQAPRAFAAAYSSDPFFAPFSTALYSEFNVLSITASGASPWSNRYKVTFVRSLSTTDYAVILSNAMSYSPLLTYNNNWTLKERAKGYCKIFGSDARTGVTTSAANAAFVIAIYGSSLKD